MYINLIDFLKGEQIDSKFCVGKVVKDLYFDNRRLCIIFDDNTFCFMEECDDNTFCFMEDCDEDGDIENVFLNESSVVDDIRYDTINKTFYFGDIINFLDKNKLIKKDELIDKLQPLREEEANKMKNYELSEYKRIKEKYNLK